MGMEMQHLTLEPTQQNKQTTKPTNQQQQKKIKKEKRKFRLPLGT